ncbi:MAG: hypothetical protein P8P74_05675 [Crocinitomicaceae bacterium]|nr:hypothetical protein [Crocinitomicaceae bacterium]
MNAVESAIQNFKAPSFGKGEVGTLHGVRSDADGYKFLRIALFGSPKIKVVKGCTLEFKNNSGATVKCTSDTKDIESVYSDKLKKGITEFEIYLDDELIKSLKKPMNAVTLTFPKKLFGKEVCSFEVHPKMFSKFFK